MKLYDNVGLFKELTDKGLIVLTVYGNGSVILADGATEQDIVTVETVKAAHNHEKYLYRKERLAAFQVELGSGVEINDLFGNQFDALYNALSQAKQAFDNTQNANDFITMLLQGLSSWFDAIQTIKAKYPKAEG